MPQINKRRKPFHIERGDVYMADLGPEDEIRGSQQAGISPVVVTQCNRQNRNSTTVVVAAGTSHLKRQDLPYHVVLPPTKGLPRRTMVCAEQRFTIEKKRLLRFCCTLDSKTMKAVTRACRKAEAGNEKHKNNRKSMIQNNRSHHKHRCS